jgi:hypothetical protein
LYEFDAITAIGDLMTDQQLALQAMSHACRILEEYLRPKPHNNERPS